MKLIGKTPSKQGHKKQDYIFSVSEWDLKVIKRFLLVATSSVLKDIPKNRKLATAHVSVTKFLSKV